MKKGWTIVILSVVLIYAAAIKRHTELVWVGVGCGIIGCRAINRGKAK